TSRAKLPRQGRRSCHKRSHQHRAATSWRQARRVQCRTFLLAAYNCNLAGGTWFYEFRLTATGHPTPLIPISLPQSVASSSARLGVPPDGGHLAHAEPAPGRTTRAAITVFDLMPAKKGPWSGPGGVTSLGWAGSSPLHFGLAWNSAPKPTFKPAVRALDTTA